MKKDYEVELKYTSYVIITVEADNEEEAETLAWRELELSGSISRGGDWELESIEEMKGESNE